MVGALLAMAVGLADEIPGYDRREAGADAYARAEAERIDAARRQVQVNDALRWRAGFPPANGVFYYPGSAWLIDPWLAPGWGGWGLRAAPTRQPVGRIELQTGPNRWESHPVYAAPGIPPPAVVDGEAEVFRPESFVPTEPPPQAPRPTGPRDF